MKHPSRYAAQLLLAAGAVVATGGAASADALPCRGLATAATHTDAERVATLLTFCEGEEGMRAWPKKLEFG